ncbi:hypothetical protein KAI04_01945 [Candidatus Pacearchaeota archaeon]|nr:hypothetical protein [Candidatus Pacearchaeota archaeon]
MKKRKRGKIILIILLIIILFLGFKLIGQEEDWICVEGDWVEQESSTSEKPKSYCVDGEVNNFKECIAAGNPAMESYPRKCINLNETFTEIIENFCTQKDVGEFCMNLYEPVCGYPLEKTFSNSCFACQDENILYWIFGECI